MERALLGNCSYQALVDRSANIDWLCWPRFDSSPVFGALLDHERGGAFSVQPVGAFTSEQDYLPNTNIVRTRFRSERGEFEVVDFAPRFLQYERHFRPNLLLRRVRKLSGEPLVRIRCEPTYDYGRIVPEVRMGSNHLSYAIPGQLLRLTANVPLSYIVDAREFVLEDEAWLALSFGEPFEAPLVETGIRFFERTRAYWERWVMHTAVPGRFQREVIRSALALKLHMFQDTGAITAATTTSIPEWPGSGRNWDYRYCWIRDSYFTLRAMRRINHVDEMEAFASFIRNVASSSDDLQPLYGIGGETVLTERIVDSLAGHRGSGPVRAGNDAFRQVQYDAYGEVIATIAPFFLDFRFRERLTASSIALVRKLLAHIDRTMELPDAGIWEIRDDNRVHTFSLLFHWVGAEVTRRIGAALGDEHLESRATQLALRARSHIERTWDAELGYFGDSDRTKNPDAALLMMINLGYLEPGDPRALSHLRTLQRHLRVDDHLVHRYRHHDGIGAEHGATFTVCGFWQVEALARLGFVDEAEACFEKMLGHANHVGLFSEDIEPKAGAQLGNFPQTYSHVGVINSAFAISPLPSEVGDP